MAEHKAGGYSTKYRFSCKEVDEETGLYYFGARYYDSRISLWYGVDPLSEKTPSWNPYRYGFNNPIRIIDPTGMGEEEAKFPPKNFTGNSWCDSDGCFNRTDKNLDYKWTDNEGKDKGVYSSKTPEVKENRSWNNKLVSATENFYGVKEQDLKGEGGTDAVLKIASKQASIILNVFSLGEGFAALNFKKGASILGNGIALFGMANDANDLTNDLTGFNFAEFTLGGKGADRLKTINAFTGMSSSFDFTKTFPKFNMAIGNIGDAKDLYELDTKFIYGKSK